MGFDSFNWLILQLIFSPKKLLNAKCVIFLMPTKSLPKKLVKRVERVVSREERKGNFDRIYWFLGKLKKADHRRPFVKLLAENTVSAGMRVRELDVSRNFPKIKKVIIKKDGSITAIDSSGKEIANPVGEPPPEGHIPGDTPSREALDDMLQ